MTTEKDNNKRAEIRQRKLAALKGVTHLGGNSYHVDADVPKSIIDTVLATPGFDSEPISGYRIFKNQVLRVKRLSVNAYARFEFFIPTAPAPFPFFAIVAREIFIETPAQPGDVATISYAVRARLDGADSGEGPRGRSWREDWWEDNGESGGPGGPGSQGEHGKTLELPPLYVFYQRVSTSAGHPSASRSLKIEYNGVAGGNGGRGGKGGRGGNGAKGTPSSCTFYPIPPFCTCDSGPGGGGNGGQAGTGGRGGHAGQGGGGGTVYFVGPKNLGTVDFHDLISQQVVRSLAGAKPGTPGEGGEPGIAGQEGGGGTKCECCNGRDPGTHGGAANPPTFGRGDAKPTGLGGLEFFVERDNEDLFAY